MIIVSCTGVRGPLSSSGKAVQGVPKSNFELFPAMQCGEKRQCGHLRMKIYPKGDSCNIPERPYNSMNSDFGGDLIKARFGHCPNALGSHVIEATREVNRLTNFLRP